MTIYVFGNPDLATDSLPLRLLPCLRERFPHLHFEIKDPNEEWEVPEELTVIDTVVGLDAPQVFGDLGQFNSAPRLTMHDFDALSQLRLLVKLGRLRSVKVIGLPPELPEDAALAFVSATLLANQP